MLPPLHPKTDAGAPRLPLKGKLSPKVTDEVCGNILCFQPVFRRNRTASTPLCGYTSSTASGPPSPPGEGFARRNNNSINRNFAKPRGLRHGVRLSCYFVRSSISSRMCSACVGERVLIFCVTSALFRGFSGYIYLDTENTGICNSIMGEFND